MPPQSIVGIYDSATGNLLREFPREYSEVTGIAFSPNGRRLLIGGFKMPNVTTKLWNLNFPNSQKPITILANDEKATANYTFSRDGKLLAYSNFQKGIPVASIWNLSTNKKIKTYKLSDEIESLAFSPNGNQLAIGTRQGQILVKSIMAN